MVKSLRTLLIAVVVALVSGTSIVQASELTYQPVNPGFGGFPNNYDYLRGLADPQNQFRDQGGGGVPIIDFPDFDIDLGGGIGGNNNNDDDTEEEANE